MNVKFEDDVRMIPVKQIDVLNPRQRGKKKFAQIAANIGKLGLKKPVTVAYAGGTNGETRYHLVCGQGRLEAYLYLGETEIPAILCEASKETLFLISLAENLARRRHCAVELIRNIRHMKSQGDNLSEIGRKTDLDVSYVRGILHLFDKGEERLLQAVEKGKLPISVAVTISTSDDKAIQKALQEAYERNDLRGKSLQQAMRLVDTRRARGKKQHGGPRKARTDEVSADSVLKTFQEETIRQRSIIQKAKLSETRLLFVVAAMRQLFQDDHFVTLLRAEGLDTLPEYLAQQIYGEGGKS